MTCIQPYTFWGCKRLSQVDLPAHLNAIGEYAFFGCESLQHIHLPASITEIAETAFDRCTELNSICVPEEQADRIRQLLPDNLKEKMYVRLGPVQGPSMTPKR